MGEEVCSRRDNIGLEEIYEKGSLMTERAKCGV